MRTFVCLEPDALINATSGMIAIQRAGVRLNVEHRGDWLPLLLTLLRRPVDESELYTTLSGAQRTQVCTLLAELEQHGHLLRIVAEDEQTAYYYLNNKRPASEASRKLEPCDERIEQLPAPDATRISLAHALANRYSSSTRSGADLSAQSLSLLLGMAYGYFSSSDGTRRRAVPAAGGLFPLSVHLSLLCPVGLENFVYDPDRSLLRHQTTSTFSIGALCNGQDTVQSARALIVLVYNVRRNSSKYGSRGLQFALIECGHAAQNVLLAAAGLGIGARCIGAVDFPCAEVAYRLAPGQIPLYAVALY